MLNKKLKKLIRDPKLFFSDMASKRIKKINLVKPKKTNGKTNYTVVSAVYNVEKYLDEFFESIINQQLDFKNNIYLILVDDGSTDSSAKIILKWEKKYPHNIKYLYKENGGQASARNLGLQHVNTEWVTFIDPDDFLNREYFSNIDNFIAKNENKKLDMISCNLIPYFEDSKKYKDNHPLKYRYNFDEKLFPINNLGKQIQLSASTAFFRNSIIKKENLEFNHEIRPTFEDAAFVANYLFYADGYATYLKNSKYYYRKRSDGSSTLDKAWEHPGLYSSVLTKGCIESMMRYVRIGQEIPYSLQVTILYHIIWYIKRLVNNEQKLSFLTDDQRTEFIENIYNAFSYIDDKVILEFGLAGSWFFHKVGILSQFKRSAPTFQIVYIESYDPKKNLVQLRYFSGSPELERIEIDGKDCLPIYAKTISHEFLSQKFVLERRIWVPISAKETMTVKISNFKTSISLGGQQKNSGIAGYNIAQYFENKKIKYEINDKYSGSWIFMDRDIQADDNAEHLYRYVKENHKNISIFFILQPNSHDWHRLKDSGFNLIAFGTKEHEDALKSCEKVISSHADHCVTNYLGPNMLQGRHFVFLQHGVIKDDLSNWLNQKENIDCFITASKEEYESISGDNTKYKFSEKEVVLTGLPRHDNLLPTENSHDKIILIMPTWRSNIVGSPAKDGLQRAINPDFSESVFYKTWSSVLHSNRLKQLADKYNYKVIFFPHVNVSPYLALFDTPDYIHILNHADIRIQDLFKKSSIMITDYSSVAFDMAYQNKSTIYYQFDEKEVFNGAHTYSQGYYDYREDGFGPVVNEETSLFNELDTLLNNSAEPSSEIIQRIKNTFPIRDGKNCERTFRAIMALDEPLPVGFLNPKIALDYALSASEHNDWMTAVIRWEKVIAHGLTDDKQMGMLKLIEALREAGMVNEALRKFDELTNDINIYLNEEYYIEQAKLAMACHQWVSALNSWLNTSLNCIKNKLLLLQCIAELRLLTDSNMLIDRFDLKQKEPFLYKIYQEINFCNWHGVIEFINENYESFSLKEIAEHKFDLILSRCYREVEDSHNAHQQLIKYESYAKKDIQHRYEIAQLAFLNGQWSKVIAQIDNAGIDIIHLPSNLVLTYLISLRHTKQASLYLETVDRLPIEILESLVFKIEMAEFHSTEKNWSNAAEAWLELIDVCEFSPYRLAEAYRMLGMVEEGVSILHREGVRLPITLDEWILRAELSHLSANWSEASHSWSTILSCYPDVKRVDIWNRFHDAKLMETLVSSKLSLDNLN